MSLGAQQVDVDVRDLLSLHVHKAQDAVACRLY